MFPQTNILISIILLVLVSDAYSQIDIFTPSNTNPNNKANVRTNNAIKNCAVLSSTGTVCYECQNEYRLSQDKTACYSLILQCLSQVDNTCQECQRGYIISEDQMPCEFIPPLKQCNQQQGQICSAQPFNQKQLKKFISNLPQSQKIPDTIFSAQTPSNDIFVEQNQNQNNLIEPDLIRTDGKYIYTFSNRVFSIFEGYPIQNAKLLSSLYLTESAEGMFLGQNYLALFGSIISANNTRTIITVINIQNRNAPKIHKKLIISGRYFDSRLTPDGYVYILTKNSLSVNGIPWFDFSGKRQELPFYSFYVYNPSIAYQTGIFVLVLAFNLDRLDTASNGLGCLITQAASQFYMSDRAIYISYKKVVGFFSDQTIIHKIFIQRSKIIPVNDTKIIGTTDNQYFYDESDNVLRVASSSIFTGDNYIHCFDNNLNLIGLLSGFGKSDRIFSTRFISNRVYVSTFNRIDPFYVIDLSDPTQPAVLGQLIVTGFSRHIFLYSDDILVGFGRQVNQTTGDVLGLKIVLIDVSDPRRPKNISQEFFRDERITSSAEFDPKGVLISKTKNVLILPGRLNNIFNGAFLFYIDSTIIKYRQKISHLPKQYKNINDFTVQRSFIIEEMLYTKSRCKIQIHRTFDVEPLKTLEIPPCKI